MVLQPSRALGVQTVVLRKLAFWLLLATLMSQAAWAAANFTPQRRVGYSTGDQWEPALAADGHGHIYILFPQYGQVSDCPACSIPTMSLLVSNDNGSSWEPPHPLVPSSSGQFDPQIVVDPVDRQTVYASWLQNNKRDVMVARSQDFGRSWYLTVAQRSVDDADKPVLTVHGPDVYVGFNHEQDFMVAASHDYAQNFSSAIVNPNAGSGSSLAGGATVDPTGAVYFSWTAYARQESSTHPVSLYVSRSADTGHTWNTILLDTSSAPPDCAAQGCEDGYLGPQIALASDAAGTLSPCGTPAKRTAALSAFTFHPPLRAAQAGPPEPMSLVQNVRPITASPQLPQARAATSASPGWTRVATLFPTNLCGMFSSAVQATAEPPGRRKLNSPGRRAVTITSCPKASAFPSATTSPSLSTTSTPRTSFGVKAAITSRQAPFGTLAVISLLPLRSRSSSRQT